LIEDHQLPVELLLAFAEVGELGLGIAQKLLGLAAAPAQQFITLRSEDRVRNVRGEILREPRWSVPGRQENTLTTATTARRQPSTSSSRFQCAQATDAVHIGGVAVGDVVRARPLHEVVRSDVVREEDGGLDLVDVDEDVADKVVVDLHI
jgi:hypothetical protein